MDGAILLPLLCSRMGKCFIGGAYSIVNGTTTAELSGSMPMEVWTAVSIRAQEFTRFLRIALQPDGKVLVCPYFNAVSGTNYNTIYRSMPMAVGTPVSTRPQ